MDPSDVYDKIIGHYGQLIRYTSLSETLLQKELTILSVFQFYTVEIFLSICIEYSELDTVRDTKMNEEKNGVAMVQVFFSHSFSSPDYSFWECNF